jgi:hypothetical protein
MDEHFLRAVELAGADRLGPLMLPWPRGLRLRPGKGSDAAARRRVTVFRRSCFAITAVAAALAFVVQARSAPPRAEDPDWPCEQRLVPKLAAAYWNGPPLEGLGDWHADPQVADLVRRLAPRRVSTQEGLSEIAAFVRSLSNDRPRRLAVAFQGLLEETDRERAALIDQLKQIGRRQRELAGLVDRLGAELDAIPPDAAGDAAARRVDLQQRHDFTARNFEEIQRTIRYACETPVELDARAGGRGRCKTRPPNES